MSATRFATHPLQLVLGLTIWISWFALAYGGVSLGCAIAAPPPEAGARTWINLSVGLFTAAIVVALLWHMWICWKAIRETDSATQPRWRFIPLLGAALHGVAIIATVFVGAPLMGLPPCV